MPEPKSPYTLELSYPAYRNWLPPDASTLTIAIQGGETEGLRDLQLRVLIAESDSDRVDQRLVALPPFTRDVVLLAPKLHSGGEVQAVLEQMVSGEALAEDRWMLRSLGDKPPGGTAYFDSRNVLIWDAAAQFPIVAVVDDAWSTSDAAAEGCQQLAAAGYSTVVPSIESAVSVEVLTPLAEERGLAIIAPVQAAPQGGVAAVASQVVNWRALAGLCGFLLPSESQPDQLLDLYRLLRVRSNSRFCVLPLTPGQGVPPDYQDVVAVRTVDSEGKPAQTLRFPGKVMFSLIQVDSPPDADRLRADLFASLLDGATGILFEGQVENLTSAPVRQVVAEAAAAGKMLRLGNPIQWSNADKQDFSSQQLEVWARRDGDLVMMAVRSTGGEPRECKLPVPMPTGELFVVGADRSVRVNSGTITARFEPRQVMILTNMPQS